MSSAGIDKKVCMVDSFYVFVCLCNQTMQIFSSISMLLFNAVTKFRFDIFYKTSFTVLRDAKIFFLYFYRDKISECFKALPENISHTWKYSSNEISKQVIQWHRFLDLIYRAFILLLFKRVQASFCLPRNHCNNLLSRPQNT